MLDFGVFFTEISDFGKIFERRDMQSERSRDNFYIYTQEDGWRKMMKDGGFKSLVEVGE